MDDKGYLYFDPPVRVVAEKKLIKVNRPLTEREIRVQKIGRNAPCGCGSGVKFKKCCYGKNAS
jgi:uncharacterized protein YchJ